MTKPTERTTVRRMPDRGAYDRQTIHAILDEALICHVGFVDEGQPFVIPTIHARLDDHLYFHGSRASRLLRVLASGAPACVSATIVDGLVLARSMFHHSMNYRSVVILGTGAEVTDRAEKLTALEAVSAHVVPGRWDDARGPNEKEMNATAIVRMKINEASAKSRSGPPKDDEDDYALPIWAGILPLGLVAGAARPDPALHPGIKVPPYLRNYTRGDGAHEPDIRL